MTNNRFLVQPRATYFLVLEAEGSCSDGHHSLERLVEIAADFAETIGSPIQDLVVVKKIGTLEATTVVKFVED